MRASRIYVFNEGIVTPENYYMYVYTVFTTYEQNDVKRGRQGFNAPCNIPEIITVEMKWLKSPLEPYVHINLMKFFKPNVV